MEQNFDVIRKKLSIFNLREVSRLSGISYPTLYSFATGKTSNPSYKTISALNNFFNEITQNDK